MIFIRSHDDEEDEEQSGYDHFKSEQSDYYKQEANRHCSLPDSAKCRQDQTEAETYCLLGWLSCVCCCWAGGLCSLFYSGLALCENRKHNHYVASHRGRKARCFGLTALMIGTITITAVLIIHFCVKRIQFIDDLYSRFNNLF